MGGRKPLKPVLLCIIWCEIKPYDSVGIFRFNQFKIVKVVFVVTRILDGQGRLEGLSRAQISINNLGDF